MNESVSVWRKVWNVARWFLLAFVLFYAFGLAMNAWHWSRTPAAVERIHARAVTMEMVMGENLPPEPLAEERDRTVAGVDVNANGVRDDVELAIHRNHPESAKIRAAQLQYAMAYQGMLTQVFSRGTLDAAIYESVRAQSCIDELHRVDYSFLQVKAPDQWTREEMDRGNELGKQHAGIIRSYTEEVEKLVVNTVRRKQQYETNVYDYDGGNANYDRGKSTDCDISLAGLSN